MFSRALLPVWAVIAFFTGGVGWMLGPIRLSSRQPLRPFLIGLALAGVYVWQYPRADRETDGRWLHRLGRESRADLPFRWSSLLGFFVGVRYGSFAAAGSDSYGYVSQARLWLNGTLRVAQPLVEEFSWPNREWMFAPLGYRPVSPDGTIVPTLSCRPSDRDGGLPRHLRRERTVLCRARCWRAACCGSRTCSEKKPPATEARRRAGGVLLLASPVFLTHVMVPMSDIPAAAGWTLVGLLVLKQRSVAAGWAAGLTLLIRPESLSAGVPAGVGVAAKSASRSAAYAKGIAPALIAIMALNTLSVRRAADLRLRIASSSRMRSARCRGISSTTSAGSSQTQTPLILLALVPLLRARRASRDGRRLSPRACLGCSSGSRSSRICFMPSSTTGSICDSCCRPIRRCSC